MIVATVMFRTAFDIELAPRDGGIKQDKTFYMFGVMHPKGPMPAKLRRRKVSAA